MTNLRETSRQLTLVAEGKPSQSHLQLDDAKLPIVQIKPGPQAEGYKYAIFDAAFEGAPDAVLCPCASVLAD